jgi:VWFA-related protein
LILMCATLALADSAAAQGTTPAETQPTIRTTASEVLLDVVVRDKHGRQVKNLKSSDVEIYEDGVRQQILSFRPVGSREVQRQQPASQTKQAPVAARSLRTVNPVCIVFHNLDPVTRKRAIEIVQEFLKSDLQPEDYFGLFVLDDRLKAVYPFTNNRSELQQAVQNAFTGRFVDLASASEAVLSANPTEVTTTTTVDRAAGTASTVVKISGGEISTAAIVGADVSTGLGANARRGDQVLEKGDFSYIAGMRETDKVITMINELGTLPGRKTVLLVTTGLVTTGDPDRFQTILANANRLGVTVYALDARGLDERFASGQPGNIELGRVSNVSKTQSARTSTLGSMREKSRQVDNMEGAVRTSDVQASLRALSDGTGGFLIANTGEFHKPFQRIVEDLDSHYEVAYRPGSGNYDGHFRKIEVKLPRADLHAESRAGYFAVPYLSGSPTLPPFETVALAVLNGRPLPHAFDFRTAAFRFGNDGANSRGALVFAVPVASLTATPQPDNTTHKLHVSLLALVKDAKGQIVDKYSLDAPYDIPAANLPGVRASAVTYTHPLSLPPGRYTVEAAVVDREGRTASTSVTEFENPEPSQGVGLSSVMLVDRVEPASGPVEVSDPFVFENKRAVPLLATNLTPEAKPYVYFVVYPDKSNAEKPKIQVEFLVGGQLLAKQTAELPPPDANGAIPMVVGAAVRPGNCQLRMTAVQGSQSATQSVNYVIAAK